MPRGHATGKAPAPVPWQQKMALPALQTRKNAEAQEITP